MTVISETGNYGDLLHFLHFYDTHSHIVYLCLQQEYIIFLMRPVVVLF